MQLPHPEVFAAIKPDDTIECEILTGIDFGRSVLESAEAQFRTLQIDHLSHFGSETGRKLDQLLNQVLADPRGIQHALRVNNLAAAARNI